MDEPETKHAVLTLRDAFYIIYLQPRGLLKMNRRAQPCTTVTAQNVNDNYESMKRGSVLSIFVHTSSDTASGKLALKKKKKRRERKLTRNNGLTKPACQFVPKVTD